MQVTVKGRDVQITDALKDYAVKKVTRLEKYYAGVKEAAITLKVQKNQHIVEVMLQGDGLKMRGEERTGDMYSSIDKVTEKLETQISKIKSRRIEKPRTASARVQAAIEASEAAEEEEFEPQIVRTKRFALDSMTPEEAAEQMTLLSHSFFLFMNPDTDQVNLVYRRRDGNFGLIEPLIR